MKVTILVLPKKTVLDPQGAATAEAMRHLGFSSARGVRVGKVIEFEADPAEEEKLEGIARDLLANPVIEEYVIFIAGREGSLGASREQQDVAQEKHA